MPRYPRYRARESFDIAVDIIISRLLLLLHQLTNTLSTIPSPPSHPAIDYPYFAPPLYRRLSNLTRWPSILPLPLPLFFEESPRKKEEIHAEFLSRPSSSKTRGKGTLCGGREGEGEENNARGWIDRWTKISSGLIAKRVGGFRWAATIICHREERDFLSNIRGLIIGRHYRIVSFQRGGGIIIIIIIRYISCLFVCIF